MGEQEKDKTKQVTIGVTAETFPGERRVAITPDNIGRLKKIGIKVIVESGAGIRAGFSDDQYADAGAEIVSDRKTVFQKSDIIAQVRGLGANPEHGKEDLDLFQPKHTLIAMFEPLTAKDEVQAIADKGVQSFALELMPRITRAQTMDVLSSMATVAGYKAVLIAAELLPKMFPMLMTAAGTISPARVFVIGAGVAGLQAIASAKRLGAVVKGYDIRPAVKEQVESLGATFVDLGLEADKSEDKGGYAREMDEEFYRRQREVMTAVVAESDVVITTAAVPGKKAPILVTEEMVTGMRPGSVIVDLAAERGGNCDLTSPGETVDYHGVSIVGPVNLPATIPFHASKMYATNLFNFCKHLMKDGAFTIDMDDEITRESMMTKDGEITNARLRDVFGINVREEGSEH